MQTMWQHRRPPFGRSGNLNARLGYTVGTREYVVHTQVKMAHENQYFQFSSIVVQNLEHDKVRNYVEEKDRN